MGANEDQVNSSPWKEDVLDSGTVAEGLPPGKANGKAMNGKGLSEVRL